MSFFSHRRPRASGQLPRVRVSVISRTRNLWVRELVGTLAVVTFLLVSGSVAAVLAAHAPHEAARERFLVVAYGDSFTSGGELGTPADSYQSWATGPRPEIRSVLDRIRDTWPAAEGVNAARWGAKMADLVSQVETSGTGARFVLVWLGINDACEGTETAQFQAQVDRGLSSILVAHPRARVLVLAVPDLAAITALHADDASARVLRAQSEVCRPFTLPDPPSWELSDAIARIEAFNGVLETGARARGFAFAALRLEPGFEARHVSPVDHLHPSFEGQARLAELTWSALAPV